MGESHWTTSTCLLPELDIIHDYRLLLRWTKGAGLFGTHFIIFVMPLASLICQPFRFEQTISHFVSHRLMRLYHHSWVQICL